MSAARRHCGLLAIVALWTLAAACQKRPLDPAPAKAPDGRGLNLLLISIDTLRADRLGCNGYDRPTSPRLDAFAAEGTRFAQAISQSPWTIPSHMTLFTALYPSSHGVNRGFRDLVPAADGTTPFRSLASDHATLAELLRAAGYETLALTGGATMAPGFGFERGFDEYVSGAQKLGPEVRTQLEAWLDRARSKPFFLFFHTFEVHAPYLETGLATGLLSEVERRELAEPFQADFGVTIEHYRRRLVALNRLEPRVTSALYDGGIRSTDTFLGQLFDELRRRDLYDRTLIVVTSDHGEEFAEHHPDRFYDAHCNSQYEELIRVPLLVRFPPLAGSPRVVDRPVGLIDVAPTLLDLLDLPIPPAMQGSSLESLLIADLDEPPWTVSGATCVEPEVKAWRTDRYKYIATFRPGPEEEHSWLPGELAREELYDLLNDPRELDDLHGREPAITARLRRLLREHFESLAAARGGEPVEFAPDPELLRQLESLGYL